MNENNVVRRPLHDTLKFWSACPTARCRRVRACVGDAQRCYAIFWPVVPEGFKVWWQAVLDARHSGRSVRQAARQADAAAAEWRKREALVRRLQK